MAVTGEFVRENEDVRDALGPAGGEVASTTHRGLARARETRLRGRSTRAADLCERTYLHVHHRELFNHKWQNSDEFGPSAIVRSLRPSPGRSQATRQPRRGRPAAARGEA
jgi:hypothetical protein